MEQRSEEWYIWRNQGLGSSEAGVLMGHQQYMSVKSLWEIKVGLRKSNFETSADMQRGVLNEDNAIYLYNHYTTSSMKPETFESKNFPFIRASLDGIDLAKRKFIEVKCPRDYKHQKTKEKGYIDPTYYAQMQHQYLVLDDLVDNADFLSYLVPPVKQQWGDLVWLPVERDKDYIKELLARELYFWSCVLKCKEPNPNRFGKYEDTLLYSW